MVFICLIDVHITVVMPALTFALMQILMVLQFVHIALFVCFITVVMIAYLKILTNARSLIKMVVMLRDRCFWIYFIAAVGHINVVRSLLVFRCAVAFAIFNCERIY